MDLLILILVLVVIAAILAALVLPIVALVIAVRSKNRLTERISRLEAAQSPPVRDALTIAGEAAAIRQLFTRIVRLEAALTAHSIPTPEEPVPYVETPLETQWPAPIGPESPPPGP